MQRCRDLLPRVARRALSRGARSAAALALVCALHACGGGASSSGVTPPTPPPSSNAAVDAVVEGAYPNGWGVEVGMYRNGQPLYVHGYGLRDRGIPDVFEGRDFWGIPQPDAVLHLPRGQFAPDDGTVFDLASVSKEFTAGAILLLQQDGKLSVNDPLSKYFPNLPSAANMTLQELLHHESGFVDYNNFGNYPDFTAAYNAFMQSGQTDYAPIVARLATFPLDFKPGTRFEYSNTNYLLLGMIVAQVSGVPLGTFLQQRIFGPLGMTRTHQGYPPAPYPDFALGYKNDGAGPVRSWQWNLAWLAGPGGLTSAVPDLERWDRAVRQPGLFTQASLSQMFAPSRFPQSFGSYADGWIVSTLQGHPYVWHDGSIGGYSTMNGTFPQDGIEIVILTNDGIGAQSGLDPYYIVPKLFPLALGMARARGVRSPSAFLKQ